MTENKTCKNCKWNEYPICKGTIQEDKSFMRIDNLRPIFGCGVKDMVLPLDRSIVIKSEIALKIDDLQKQIDNLKGV